MPMKWTPDNDQLLLLKILETHEISVDAKKITAAWPDDRGEAPTARAVTERLVKIRQMARQNGAGNFNIASAQTKSSKGSAKSSPAKTPTKPRTNNVSTPNKFNASPTKRTRDGHIKAESIEQDPVTPCAVRASAAPTTFRPTFGSGVPSNASQFTPRSTPCETAPLDGQRTSTNVPVSELSPPPDEQAPKRARRQSNVPVKYEESDDGLATFDSSEVSEYGQSLDASTDMGDFEV